MEKEQFEEFLDVFQNISKGIKAVEGEIGALKESIDSLSAKVELIGPFRTDNRDLFASALVAVNLGKEVAPPGEERMKELAKRAYELADWMITKRWESSRG